MRLESPGETFGSRTVDCYYSYMKISVSPEAGSSPSRRWFLTLFCLRDDVALQSPNLSSRSAPLMTDGGKVSGTSLVKPANRR